MRFKSIASPEDTVAYVSSLMSKSKDNKGIIGLCVIVNQSNQVIGTVTDGDIRKCLAKGGDEKVIVKEIMNNSPITIVDEWNYEKRRSHVYSQSLLRNIDILEIRAVVVVNKKNEYVDVKRLSELIRTQVEFKKITVIGQGFVGLTLSTTLANSGLYVSGYDKNLSIVSQLSKGLPHFYEEGLENLLSSLVKNNAIKFSSKLENSLADIYIISVGTPLNKDDNVCNELLISCLEEVSKVLKSGDLVILRSTVPIGTSRDLVIPILEKSGLKCSEQFKLAFAPERTIEGKALQELHTLPQVIGGIDKESINLASQLFKKITNTIIEVGSIEEAELIKLVNNSYRDLIFAFSNEVAMVCESYNINANSLINAANEGYPRDPIPRASPGVGGTCLTKDPVLFSNPYSDKAYKPRLPLMGRGINESVLDTIKYKVNKFSEIYKEGQKPNVLVVGIAFKGEPETSDTRDSMSLKLVDIMKSSSKITCLDTNIEGTEFNRLGLKSISPEEIGAEDQFDCVIVMNNSNKNTKYGLQSLFSSGQSIKLIFDGWSQFDKEDIERNGHIYCTLGYMSKV